MTDEKLPVGPADDGNRLPIRREGGDIHALAQPRPGALLPFEL